MSFKEWRYKISRGLILLSDMDNQDGKAMELLDPMPAFLATCRSLRYFDRLTVDVRWFDDTLLSRDSPSRNLV